MELPLAIYLASILGAVALLLMMPKAAFNLPRLGALLGVAGLGGVWLVACKELPWGKLGVSDPAFVYHYLFSAIAIVAAVRVITHTQPLYSALWFIMVVLSSAGLFIVLSAHFMAVALVIIYGGAILVTYMFVIMLASHAGDAPDPRDTPHYDKVAREPLMAIGAGFLLLAMLLNVAFAGDLSRNQRAQGLGDSVIIKNILTDRPAAALAEQLGDNIVVGDPTSLTNVERIGLDLFQNHPLGLELAGVILLICLIGAVVISKTIVYQEHRA